MRTRSCLLLSAALLLFSALPAHAVSTPAVEWAETTRDFTNGTWSLGFRFDVLAPVMVTHLGFYDSRGDDLTERHDVGIFAEGGGLLTSGTVIPGDVLIGHIRYTSIAPYLLGVGTYRIAAVTLSEEYTWDPLGFFTDPRIVFREDRFTASGSLVYPENSSGGIVGWFGADFMIEAVPEPGTIMLLGAGFLGLAAAARRRKAS